MACSKCIALRCIEPFDLSTRFNLAANGLFKLQTRDGSEFLEAFNFSERERLREGKRSLKNFNIDFANTFYIFFLFVLEVSSITIFDSTVYCSDWKVYISVTWLRILFFVLERLTAAPRHRPISMANSKIAINWPAPLQIQYQRENQSNAPIFRPQIHFSAGRLTFFSISFLSIYQQHVAVASHSAN